MAWLDAVLKLDKVRDTATAGANIAEQRLGSPAATVTNFEGSDASEAKAAVVYNGAPSSLSQG